MTVKEVEARVAEIETNAWDASSAHGQEDDLRSDVLDAIAKGQGDDPALLAKAALATSEIQFPRWYA